MEKIEQTQLVVRHQSHTLLTGQILQTDCLLLHAPTNETATQKLFEVVPLRDTGDLGPEQIHHLEY